MHGAGDGARQRYSYDDRQDLGDHEENKSEGQGGAHDDVLPRLWSDGSHGRREPGANHEQDRDHLAGRSLPTRDVELTGPVDFAVERVDRRRNPVVGALAARRAGLKRYVGAALYEKTLGEIGADVAQEVARQREARGQRTIGRCYMRPTVEMPAAQDKPPTSGSATVGGWSVLVSGQWCSAPRSTSTISRPGKVDARFCGMKRRC